MFDVELCHVEMMWKQIYVWCWDYVTLKWCENKFMFDGGIMSRSNDVKTNFQSKHKSFSEFN